MAVATSMLNMLRIWTLRNAAHVRARAYHDASRLSGKARLESSKGRSKPQTAWEAPGSLIRGVSVPHPSTKRESRPKLSEFIGLQSILFACYEK